MHDINLTGLMVIQGRLKIKVLFFIGFSTKISNFLKRKKELEKYISNNLISYKKLR